jgi:hypothetical protein
VTSTRRFFARRDSVVLDASVRNRRGRPAWVARAFRVA